MKVQEISLPADGSLISKVAVNLKEVHQQLFLSWQLDGQQQMQRVQELLTDLDVPAAFDQTQFQFMLPLTALPLLIKWSRQLFDDDHLLNSLLEIKKHYQQFWRAGRFCFNVTDHPLIYAILNITPDSFYDGGKYYQEEQWQRRISQLVDEGADIIEVGGQTTRPGGFAEITPDEEKRRIIPVISFIRQHYPQVAIAVDTYKLPVMAAAINAGADIINDVEAFETVEKRQLMANSAVGLVTMHSSRHREYDHLTLAMHRFFEHNLADLTAAGIQRERIVIDQGIGYSQTADGNQDYAMMRNINQFNDFHRPLLVAISRKGFGKKLLGLAKKDRLPVTLVAETYMYLQGGRILRVHDVAATKQLLVMVDAIISGYWNRPLNDERENGKAH